MARSHGKNVQVYFDGRDASCDLSEVSITASADTHESTTFCTDGWKTADPGLIGWEAGIEGFYDPAAGGYGRQMEDLLGAACDCLSIFDGDADAIGDTGVLLGPGVVKSRGQPINVAELVKLGGEIQGSGKAGLFGKLLMPHGAHLNPGNTDALDNGAASANGGRANIHVTVVSGTWTIKIQHSPDNTNWTDLVTFTQFTSVGGPQGESKEVSGQVEQYLRVNRAENVSGTIYAVCGFARY